MNGLFQLFGVYFNCLKMANIGELPYGVLGTSQKENKRRVHSGCKEKSAARPKFVVFPLLLIE